jgi:hypothetical protein
MTMGIVVVCFLLPWVVLGIYGSMCKKSRA